MIDENLLKEYHAIVTESWKALKGFISESEKYGFDPPDAFWTKLISWADEFIDKYRGTEVGNYAEKSAVSVIDELHHKYIVANKN